MPSINGSDNPGPGLLPTFAADTQQTTRVREFPGIAGTEMAGVFHNLANQLEGWEDRAAQEQGVREGKVAGLDPNYRPDDDPSIRGMARRNAANATYGNMVEAQARSNVSAAYDQWRALPRAQRTPDALTQTFAQLKGDFDANHVFPEIKGQFDTAFSGLTLPFQRAAQADLDARQQDQARASFLVNQNSARDTAIRVAGLPSSSDADVAGQVKQHDAAVDAAVAQGTYSAEQGVKLKDGFRQDVLGQRVMTLFANTPDADKAKFADRFAAAAGGGGDYYARLRAIESGGDDRADSGIAKGRYQFTDGTWSDLAQRHPELGLTPGGRSDPDQQDKAVRVLTEENAQTLRSAGVQPTNANLYMAHFLGAPGAIKFFGALADNPNQTFAAAFPKEAAANPGFARQSLADVYANFGRKFDRGSDYGRTLGLTADTVDRVSGAMNSSLRSIQSQAEHTQRQALADIGADQKQMEAGFAVPDAAWTAKRADYGASLDPVVAGAFAQADAIRNLYAGFKGLSPEAVEAQVATLRGQLAGGATPYQAGIAEAADKYADRLRSDLARDPLRRAAADGVIPGLAPLDTSSPAALAASLQKRAATADQVAQRYHIAPPMATPEEKESLKALAAAGGPPMVAAAAAVASALRERAGPFLAEIGGDAPSFAQLGRLAATGGDPSFMQDAAWAIGQDHQQGAKIQRPAPESVQQAIETVYGSAFRFIPDYAQGAKNLAGSALAAQIMREGLDPKALDQRMVKETLQKAAGATFAGGAQYGGVATWSPAGGWFSHAEPVLAPPSVRADQFGAVVRAIGDADLKSLANPPTAPDGTTMTAKQLQAAHLTSLAPGVYLVSKGDPAGEDPQWATAKDGGRFLLDLNALAPALRQRLPGAYKGAAS